MLDNNLQDDEQRIFQRKESDRIFVMSEAVFGKLKQQVKGGIGTHSVLDKYDDIDYFVYQGKTFVSHKQCPPDRVYEVDIATFLEDLHNKKTS